MVPVKPKNALQVTTLVCMDVRSTCQLLLHKYSTQVGHNNNLLIIMKIARINAYPRVTAAPEIQPSLSFAQVTASQAPPPPEWRLLGDGLASSKLPFSTSA